MLTARPAAAPAVPAAEPSAAPPSSIAFQLVQDLMREIDGDFATEQGVPLKRVSTLRSLIRAGRMKPRYSVWLWVRIMRALAQRHADIPPWLDELIMCCMEKDLKKRYRTTDDVSAALLKLKGAVTV